MTNASTETIKEKAIGAISALIIREFIMKGLAVVGQLFLARLLVPDYFGLFAIIVFVVGLVELFTDIGLTHSIIQSKKELSQEIYSTIFYIKQILVTGGVIILVVFSFKLLIFYPQLPKDSMIMLRVFSLSLFVKPLESMLVAFLERELKYWAIPRVDIVGIVIYYVVAILLAMKGFGAWSFIYAILIKEVCELIITFYFKPWLPSFCFNLKKVGKQVKYGTYLQFGFIMSFLHGSTIPVIGGLLASPYYVGLLDWSVGLASIPKSINENYGRVAFSSFSRIQDNKILLSRGIEKSISILWLTSVIFLVATYVLGADIIRLLFTERWVPAATALNLFVASIFFLSGTTPLLQGILVGKKSRLVIFISIVNLLLEWSIAFIAVKMIGFNGIALASFISSVFLFILVALISPGFGLSIRFSNILPSKIIIFITSMLVGLLLNNILMHSLILTLVKLALILVFFCISVLLFDKNDALYLYKYLKSFVLKLLTHN